MPDKSFGTRIDNKRLLAVYKLLARTDVKRMYEKGLTQDEVKHVIALYEQLAIIAPRLKDN